MVSPQTAGDYLPYQSVTGDPTRGYPQRTDEGYNRYGNAVYERLRASGKRKDFQTGDCLTNIVQVDRIWNLLGMYPTVTRAGKQKD